MKARITNRGNWNIRHPNMGGVYTKPLAVVDKKVWKHDELLELIEIYHYVDMRAMEMILDPNEDTGEVKSIECPFIYKVMNLVNKLRKDIDKLGGKDNGISSEST